MRRARFAAPARREFLAEIAYYHMLEPRMGARFAAAVEEAIARALAFPLSGSEMSKNTRRVFVRDFPFAVVYRPEPDGMLIIAITHHSRRPEYWHLRVQEASHAYWAPDPDLIARGSAGKGSARAFI